ncbi:helix-turn-helix domain-containing protein [Pseudohongiella spirulinae]|uniref:HTH cro/C1-type domain-containing protein n=1 Tax=Pseudohongiella spirulinae TaxID=1249552 RepID=A0A0S2KBQ0_9GAMM|nr:helix-turn-helix transcriptional regulator [Pseudohongiella spirulinae]ALO45524.1 hypothetical protein PS2015_852 [Pseudohongiella spirulinae]
MVHLRSRLAVYVRNRRGTATQREFARRTGLAQSTIMRIENEEQNVTIKTLEQLCQAFKVDVGELFPVVKPAQQYHRPTVGSEQRPMVHDSGAHTSAADKQRSK